MDDRLCAQFGCSRQLHCKGVGGGGGHKPWDNHRGLFLYCQYIDWYYMWTQPLGATEYVNSSVVNSLFSLIFKYSFQSFCFFFVFSRKIGTEGHNQLEIQEEYLVLYLTQLFLRVKKGELFKYV